MLDYNIELLQKSNIELSTLIDSPRKSSIEDLEILLKLKNKDLSLEEIVDISKTKLSEENIHFIISILDSYKPILNDENNYYYANIYNHLYDTNQESLFYNENDDVIFSVFNGSSFQYLKNIFFNLLNQENLNNQTSFNKLVDSKHFELIQTWYLDDLFDYIKNPNTLVLNHLIDIQDYSKTFHFASSKIFYDILEQKNLTDNILNNFVFYLKDNIEKIEKTNNTENRSMVILDLAIGSAPLIKKDLAIFSEIKKIICNLSEESALNFDYTNCQYIHNWTVKNNQDLMNKIPLIMEPLRLNIVARIQQGVKEDFITKQNKKNDLEKNQMEEFFSCSLK